MFLRCQLSLSVKESGGRPPSDFRVKLALNAPILFLKTAVLGLVLEASQLHIPVPTKLGGLEPSFSKVVEQRKGGVAVLGNGANFWQVDQTLDPSGLANDVGFGLAVVEAVAVEGWHEGGHIFVVFVDGDF